MAATDGLSRSRHSRAEPRLPLQGGRRSAGVEAAFGVWGFGGDSGTVAIVEQPAGTVTLVFTDIEGSTRLLHELGQDAYREALAEHRRVVRAACARHGGYEVDYEGDSFFYAFASAAAAVSAVAEARLGLASGLIRVRVGVHTGEPGLDPPKYVGLDVHRAARIMGAAHGGQVLLSQTTRALVEVEATELGEHRLKDIDEPVRLFQLGAEAFPPLKTISNTNLPRPASSFVGRAAEVEEIVSLLRAGTRLLTLTGPGGSGKTRLAIEAAAELGPELKAGVFWVGLASLRDPALLSATIAETLGAKHGLANHIGERELMLVLDNLEQVIEAAPELSALVEACPNLRLLVTSRELLRVRGETEFSVPPLAERDAVQLFCDRAGVEPDETVRRLCRALDNLPLALELAAARAGVFTPTQLLERISGRLDLLKGGRDADPRQRTLRATIEWSHDLLNPGEQTLFARLAVFSGGWTLEAAERICDADPETLGSLLDKSLIRRREERFWMLETIREFAAEQLEDETGLRHAEWCLAFAEEAEPELAGAAQAVWLGRLDSEHDNLRAALAFLRQSGWTALEIRFAGALWRYWSFRGFLNEGQDRLEEILAPVGNAFAVEHEKLLYGGAIFALDLGDYNRAEELAAARLAISRAQTDPTLLASSLLCLGTVADAKGEHERASVLWSEAADLAREQGDKLILALTLNNLGWQAMYQRDDQTARTRLEEALALLRELSDAHGQARIILLLSGVARAQGRIDEAYALAHEALSLAHALGDKAVILWSLEWASEQAASDAQADRAARLLGAADAVRENTGHEPYPEEQQQMELITTLLDAQLDKEQVDAARAEGHAMTLDQAVAYALDPADQTAPPSPPSEEEGGSRPPSLGTRYRV